MKRVLFWLGLFNLEGLSVYFVLFGLACYLYHN